MKALQFYRCETCGNLILIVGDEMNRPWCCGKAMTPVKANTDELVHEKHIPSVSRDGDRVTVIVGTGAHPMTKEHYIGWIILMTDRGAHARRLSPGGRPEADFILCRGETVTGAYAYCNLHGLWHSEQDGTDVCCDL